MDNKKKILGIVGAGVSNLTFLHYLKMSNSFKISLFEKSKIVSGRAATRRANGFIFDNGANYLFSKHPEIIELITKDLDSTDLITISKSIYPFNRNNIINFNHDEVMVHNQLKKYSYKQGILQLGKLLHNQIMAKTDIIFNKMVTKIIEKEENIYELFSENESLGVFDYLIFGIPSMNLLEILKNSQFLSKNQDLLSRSIESVSLSKYRIIYALALAFQPKIDFNFYGLVNSDREHAISWLSVENEKEGHVIQENTTLLVIQTGDKFSQEVFENNLKDEEITKLIIGELNKLIVETKNVTVTFSDLKRWKYALPTKAIDQKIVEEFANKNLFLIGDCLLNKGRVDEAMMTGINLAKSKF